jgi:hypothetical protein
MISLLICDSPVASTVVETTGISNRIGGSTIIHSPWRLYIQPHSSSTVGNFESRVLNSVPRPTPLMRGLKRGGSLQRLAKLFCPSRKAGFDQFKGVRRAEQVDVTIKGGFEHSD